MKNLYNAIVYNSIKQKLEGKMLDWYIRTSDVVPLDDDPRGFKRITIA